MSHIYFSLTGTRSGSRGSRAQSPTLGIGLAGTSPPNSRGGSPLALPRSSSPVSVNSPVNSPVNRPSTALNSPVKSPMGGKLAPLGTSTSHGNSNGGHDNDNGNGNGSLSLQLPLSPQAALESSPMSPMHSPLPINSRQSSSQGPLSPGSQLMVPGNEGGGGGREGEEGWPKEGFGQRPRPLSQVGQRRQNSARAVGLDATFLRYTKRPSTASALMIPIRTPDAPLDGTEEEKVVNRYVIVLSCLVLSCQRIDMSMLCVYVLRTISLYCCCCDISFLVVHQEALIFFYHTL